MKFVWQPVNFLLASESNSKSGNSEFLSFQKAADLLFFIKIKGYTVWSVNNGLLETSGNLKKLAAEVSGRFPAGFQIL